MLTDRVIMLTISGAPKEKKGSRPCIPGRKSRRQSIKYDKRKYKQCNRIEIIFGRHTLGQMSDSLLLRYLPHCKCHLLAMNPEPKRLEMSLNCYHSVACGTQKIAQ